MSFEESPQETTMKRWIGLALVALFVTAALNYSNKPKEITAPAAQPEVSKIAAPPLKQIARIETQNVPLEPPAVTQPEPEQPIVNADLYFDSAYGRHIKWKAEAPAESNSFTNFRDNKADENINRPLIVLTYGEANLKIEQRELAKAAPQPTDKPIAGAIAAGE
jgi:hypothetical protein